MMGKFLLNIPSGRKGGIMFALAVFVLVILGIFGASLHRSMVEKSNFINAHSISLRMSLVANEIADVFSACLAGVLQNPESELLVKILETSPENFPVDAKSFVPDWEGKLSFLSSKDFANLKYSLDARFVDAEPLSKTGAWSDPWEKQFYLELIVEVYYSKAGFRSQNRKYFFRRQCKTNSLLFPVFSKFTFFVSKPETTDESNEGYNCFSNLISGEPTQYSKNLPIVLFNNKNLNSTDLTKNGYVFLGGDQNIELHVSAGSDEDNGEFFHFFSLNSSSKGAPVFDQSELPNSSFFSSVKTLSSDPEVKGQLGIQGAIFGFYEYDNLSPPNNMNFKNSLEGYFSSTKARTMKSSILHLFGSLRNPSPAIVFGMVKRVFAQYSFLTVDTDGDGKKEQRWMLLPVPAVYELADGSSTELWDQVTLPKFFTRKGTGETTELDGTLELRTLFLTSQQYFNYSSRLWVEDYNLTYEHMMDENSSFPPQKDFKTLTGLESQQDGKSVSIVREKDGAELFKGNLNEIKISDLLSGRITQIVKNETSFREAHVSDGKLALNGKTIYLETDLNLNENLEVISPGTIVVNGKLTIKGDITSDNNSVLNLVVVKSGNDIVFSGSNQKIAAHVIAPEGTVKLSQGTRISLTGGLTTATLNPEDWLSGSEITFEPEHDPIFSQTDDYVFFMADFYDRWGLKNEANFGQ
ncbi:MAG: hypothetical protein AB1403_01155 [Candidatus Riflebacteria bacterium]